MAVHFVSGCFDKFHPGHQHLLDTAKHYGGSNHTLVVILNTQNYIRTKKNRPEPDTITQRLFGVFQYADYVSVSDDILNAIEFVKPDRIFVGDDYTIDQVVGHDLVKEVVIVPRFGGYSSSKVY